ncbi:MAG: type II toxin-antitoxin system RelE/ParE family toxin [Proteobacteria bacterium]|nr:type II toxin-antitoxin system RelE/ParE family toxin [Pseudomonadota bacterium]
MARVVIKKGAVRVLRRMDRKAAERISAALKKLEDDPNRRDLDIRALKAQHGFRLRVGAWRVLFERRGEMVTVHAIRPRGRAYRR